MRTRDFAFVSLCYEGSGEEICTGYAMAASGRMQYDYKQTNNHPPLSTLLISVWFSAYVAFGFFYWFISDCSFRLVE